MLMEAGGCPASMASDRACTRACKCPRSAAAAQARSRHTEVEVQTEEQPNAHPRSLAYTHT